MYCNKCGQKLTEDSLFCFKCGSAVVDAKQYENNVETKTYEQNNTAQNDVIINETIQDKIDPVKSEPENKINPFEIKLSLDDQALINNKRTIQIGIGFSYIYLLILFLTDWFRMPIVSLFSTKLSTFSVTDIMGVLFKTGAIFELGGKSLEKAIKTIPFSVKLIAIIIVSTYIISIFLLLISAIRLFIGRPRKKTLISSLVLSFICTASSLYTISYIKKFIAEEGDDIFGSSLIIDFSKTFYVLLISLILVFGVICYLNSKFLDVSRIIDEQNTQSLFTLFVYSKLFKPVCIVLGIILLILIIRGIVKHIDKNTFHSAKGNYSTSVAEFPENIKYYGVHTELSDMLKENGFNNYEEFHIEKADGAFTLWCSEAYKDDNWQYGIAQKRIDGEFEILLSDKADVSIYVVYPDQSYRILPVKQDKQYNILPMMAGMIESYEGSITGDNDKEQFTDPLYGFYRIVMVTDEVEDIDVAFGYTNNYEDSHDYYDYKLFYPGNFRNYSKSHEAFTAYASEREKYEPSTYEPFEEGTEEAEPETTENNSDGSNLLNTVIPVDEARARVKKDNVTIRSEAASDSEVLDKLKKDTKVTILSSCVNNETGNTWYKIKYNSNKEGYIREDLIEKYDEEVAIDEPLSDGEIRSVFKNSLMQYFDINDLYSVFFADLNQDGKFECYVMSMSEGDGIFYQDGNSVKYFTDDIGSGLYSFVLDKSIVSKEYNVGSYSGYQFYKFNGESFENIGDCYHDWTEEKYYINGKESSESDMQAYVWMMIENAVRYDGSSDYDSAPVYR